MIRPHPSPYPCAQGRPEHGLEGGLEVVNGGHEGAWRQGITAQADSPEHHESQAHGVTHAAMARRVRLPGTRRKRGMIARDISPDDGSHDGASAVPRPAVAA